MDEATASPAPESSPRAAAPRSGLRFSLLGLVWLLTVTALGIGLYRTGREVAPLRDAVIRMRQELGLFNVDDQSQIHVRRTRVKFPTAWQWRLFLPGSRTYTLHYFLGSIADRTMVGREKWFQLLRSQSRNMGESLESGEFSFEALITKYDGNMWLRLGKVVDSGATYGLPPGYEWLADETSWVVSSDASYEAVKMFDAGKPMVLLEMEPSVHAGGADDDGDDSESAEAESSVGERLVLWIDAK